MLITVGSCYKPLVMCLITAGDVPHHRRFVAGTVGDALRHHHHRFVTQTGSDESHHRRF